MMVHSNHRVIPAQAGIHARGLPLLQCMWTGPDMDPGLRRDDIAPVEAFK